MRQLCVLSAMNEGKCLSRVICNSLHGVRVNMMEEQPLMVSGRRITNRIRDRVCWTQNNPGGQWSRGGTGGGTEGQVREEVKRPRTEAKPAEQGTKAEQKRLEPNKAEQTGLEPTRAEQMTTMAEQTGQKTSMVEQESTSVEQTGQKTSTAEQTEQETSMAEQTEQKASTAE